MNSLTHLTLTQARAAIRARKISPLELTDAHLARIETLNPQLNAYLQITADSARDAARAATRALKRGAQLAPLHGIPLALKDLFDQRGAHTTAGSILLKDNIATDDAFAVKKLRAAGAILLGKLNMHEWAYGVTTINPHFGACRNPWNPEHIVGGSSGGSGAAVAARMCMGALGSDTGGSIRIPASLCGIVGLKPTYGRVSLRGAIPLGWSLDHAGPMARTVPDVALMLQVIQGYDADDPASVDAPAFKPANAARKFKIGIEPDFLTELGPETESAVRAALQTLKKFGTVREIKLEGHADASRASSQMLLAEAAAYHRERMRDHADQIGADVLRRLQLGAEVSGADYARARRTQAEWRRKMMRVFEEIDLLVLPATPAPAPKIAGTDALVAATNLTRFTRLTNLTGNPALVLPCGFTRAGLPIGLQIVGAHWREDQVLQLGLLYERATEWHTRMPAI
ncbi:MAG: Asp-tRNA(Asn)/Glu-tRNA(Gln) amidotransferase subunit GatA [Chloroflexi bacterium]|nr:Asp-tRNA(Asn)/Glu-tRNA(Gln) amidotransferase subunit GatA [Chloroflexota bacterium]